MQPQAFRIGERAWAVQFHPEARRGQVLGWFEADGEERLPRPLAELERELEAKIDGWHRLGRSALPAFLDAAAAAAVASAAELGRVVADAGGEREHDPGGGGAPAWTIDS